MPGIKRNIAFLALSQGVGVAGDLVMVALTARYLGVHRFGQQSVLRSTAMFALPLLGGGLSIHIIRAIARDPNGAASYLGNVLTLRWALGLGAGLLAALIIPLLPLSPSVETASFAAILLALSGVWMSVPRAILIAYERNEYNLLMGAVAALISVALTVVAIRLDSGVAGTILALAVAGFLAAGMAQLLLNRYLVRPRLGVNLAQWREIMHSALPLGVSGVLRRSYTRIDVWLLAALAGASAAALFSVAYRVALQATDVSRLLGSALLPRISLLAKSRREDLGTMVHCLLHLLLVISVCFAGLAAAVALPLLMLIVGPEFRESVAALRLVSIVCVAALPSAIIYLVLVALNKERAAMLTMAATVVWNVLADLVLIPRLGVLGACYGTISAEWVSFGISLYLVQRELRIPGIWLLLVRLLLAGTAMAAAIGAAGPTRPWVGAGAGMVVFAACSFLLRVFPVGAVRRLRRALALGAQAAPIADVLEEPSLEAAE